MTWHRPISPSLVHIAGDMIDQAIDWPMWLGASRKFDSILVEIVPLERVAEERLADSIKIHRRLLTAEVGLPGNLYDSLNTTKVLSQLLNAGFTVIDAICNKLDLPTPPVRNDPPTDEGQSLSEYWLSAPAAAHSDLAVITRSGRAASFEAKSARLNVVASGDFGKGATIQWMREVKPHASRTVGDLVEMGDLVSGWYTTADLLQVKSVCAAALIRSSPKHGRRERMRHVQAICDSLAHQLGLSLTSTGRNESVTWALFHDPADLPVDDDFSELGSEYPHDAYPR